MVLWIFKKSKLPKSLKVFPTANNSQKLSPSKVNHL